MEIFSNKNRSILYGIVFTLVYIFLRFIFVDNKSIDLFTSTNNNGTNFRIMVFVLLISFITKIIIYTLVYTKYKFINIDEIIYTIFLGNKKYIDFFKDVNYDNVKIDIPFVEKNIKSKGPILNFSISNLFYYINQNRIRGLDNKIFNELENFINTNYYNSFSYFRYYSNSNNKIKLLNLKYKKTIYDNVEIYEIDTDDYTYKKLENVVINYIIYKLKIKEIPNYTEILFSDTTNTIIFSIGMFLILYSLWIIFNLIKKREYGSVIVIILLFAGICIFQFTKFIPDQYKWLQMSSNSSYVLNNIIFSNKDFSSKCVNK